MKKTRKQFPISYIDGFMGGRIKTPKFTWKPNSKKVINPHILMVGSGGKRKTGCTVKMVDLSDI